MYRTIEGLTTKRERFRAGDVCRPRCYSPPPATQTPRMPLQHLSPAGIVSLPAERLPPAPCNRCPGPPPVAASELDSAHTALAASGQHAKATPNAPQPPPPPPPCPACVEATWCFRARFLFRVLNGSRRLHTSSFLPAPAHLQLACCHHPSSSGPGNTVGPILISRSCIDLWHLFPRPAREPDSYQRPRFLTACLRNRANCRFVAADNLAASPVGAINRCRILSTRGTPLQLSDNRSNERLTFASP